MAPGTDPEEEPWEDDDPDGYMDEDMEYDEYPEDLIELDDEDEDEEEEEEEELDFESMGGGKSLTARQRIEIAREDRWLKSMMVDFEDIDEFDRIEGFSDCYVGEFSH